MEPLQKNCRFYLLLILISGFGVQCKFPNIKDFLGDEPLTTRRIVEDLLEYFQVEDPRGIPVLIVPTTVEVAGPITLSSFTMENVKITGLSRISLEHFDVDLDKLQTQVKIRIPHLEILGQYKWDAFFFSSEGDLNVTFTELDVGAICYFGVDEKGVIEVVNIKASLAKEEFIPDLTGLSIQHSAMVYAADALFDSVVAKGVAERLTERGMGYLNPLLQKRLKDKPFPVDISPVDYQIAKLRSDIIRKRNMDPFVLESKEINYLGMTIQLNNIELRGLSTLHRSDIIRTEYVDKRFYVTIEIGAQELKGSTDWTIYSTLIPIGSGHADVVVESLRVSLEVQQDADVRHPPILRRIDVELGNLSLRSRGERTIDYILEAAVNYFPNIFRSIIVDMKIEGRLKSVIQERFNTLNLQHLIFEQLNKLER